jgi:hypothetical protein
MIIGNQDFKIALGIIAVEPPENALDACGRSRFK